MREKHPFPWTFWICILVAVAAVLTIPITGIFTKLQFEQSTLDHRPHYSPIAAAVKSKPMVMDSPACHCDPHALDFAVMDRLKEAGVDTSISSAYDGDKQTLDKEVLLHKKVRAIAEKIQDHCLRDKYIHWLDYYDEELQRAFENIGKQEGEKSESQKRNDELKKQFAEAEKCKRDGTVPKMRTE